MRHLWLFFIIFWLIESSSTPFYKKHALLKNNRTKKAQIVSTIQIDKNFLIQKKSKLKCCIYLSFDGFNTILHVATIFAADFIQCTCNLSQACDFHCFHEFFENVAI